jgi:hypothetical protein
MSRLKILRVGKPYFHRCPDRVEAHWPLKFVGDVPDKYKNMEV